jgi:hypothetical protein
MVRKAVFAAITPKRRPNRSAHLILIAGDPGATPKRVLLRQAAIDLALPFCESTDMFGEPAVDIPPPRQCRPHSGSLSIARNRTFKSSTRLEIVGVSHRARRARSSEVISVPLLVSQKSGRDPRNWLRVPRATSYKAGIPTLPTISRLAGQFLATSILSRVYGFLK